MSIDAETKNNVPIAEAAKVMGKSLNFLRINIQRKRFPFGIAEKVSGDKYTYYISPEKFYEFVGKPLPDKYKEKKRLPEAERYTVITDPAIARQINWSWRG